MSALEISTSAEPMSTGSAAPQIQRIPMSRSNSNSQSNPSSASSTPKFRTKPCGYFAVGKCRFGEECKFLHDPATIGTLPPPGSYSQSNSVNSSAASTPSKNGMASHSFSPRGGSPGQHHFGPGSSPHQGHHGGQRPSHPPHSPAGAALSTPILLNDGVPPPGTVLTTPPTPIIVNIPPNLPVFSIDVECVATGIQHNSRSVAQVSLVDAWSRPLFNVYIKQEKPVVSYLSELTGITKELLDTYGIPLADAMAQLRSLLSPQAILVGHSIQNDVQWLQLAQGIDYHSLINLSDLFRVWNMNHQSFTYFSQDHIASIWLGMKTEGRQHNAVADAGMAMSLFNAYRTFQFDTNRIFDMQRQMLLAPRVRGFSALHPIVDGCCMGNRKNCICGAPFE